METHARHLAVGGFVLLLVAGIFVFILWVAKFQGETVYDSYFARFSGSVSQLRVNTTVNFGGIPVGRVTDVRIDPEDSALARVDFEVRSGTPIRVDSRATLEMQSIAGGVGLAISRGSSEAELLVPGSEVQAAQSALERLTRQAPDILAKIDGIANNVNEMLSPANRQALTETLSNLRDVSQHLKDRKEDIDVFLSDSDTAMKEIALAGTEFRKLAEQLQESVGPATTEAQQALKAFGDMARSFETTSAQMSALLAENREPLRQFSGTALYEATDLLSQLRELVASMARITQEIERDPARFFLSDRSKGVVAP
ncbi:phospholipid/cholesterol/gamma-HCH transport system substrate-binding protein [Dongia mobilis]|uniref:Phospholipid/cholesterol/gamma-HCH transport system substrate-binding protein n=1 Tax=Dongia mobilis TaxID=578943 RepID=A0A4R6WXQ0_9PROT|nr:MlaD family protein [Dongia mobilis]TDQ84477.1 phospholipid/cholesterol/gamma-HCH transport system substrate-binding protein [Dongia mobilis]